MRLRNCIALYVHATAVSGQRYKMFLQPFGLLKPKSRHSHRSYAQVQGWEPLGVLMSDLVSNGRSVIDGIKILIFPASPIDDDNPASSPISGVDSNLQCKKKSGYLNKIEKPKSTIDGTRLILKISPTKLRKFAIDNGLPTDKSDSVSDIYKGIHGDTGSESDDYYEKTAGEMEKRRQQMIQQGISVTESEASESEQDASPKKKQKKNRKARKGTRGRNAKTEAGYQVLHPAVVPNDVK